MKGRRPGSLLTWRLYAGIAKDVDKAFGERFINEAEQGLERGDDARTLLPRLFETANTTNLDVSIRFVTLTCFWESWKYHKELQAFLRTLNPDIKSFEPPQLWIEVRRKP